MPLVLLKSMLIGLVGFGARATRGGFIPFDPFASLGGSRLSGESETCVRPLISLVHSCTQLNYQMVARGLRLRSACDRSALDLRVLGVLEVCVVTL